MNDLKTGRVTGALLFLQFLALMAGFVLLAPAVTTDFLQKDPDLEGRMRAGVAFLMVASAVTVAIAAFLANYLRRFSAAAAVLLVVVSTLWVVAQMVDNVNVLSMLSLSKHVAESGAVNSDLYNILAMQVRATRNWSHYTALLVMDVWFALFYGVLFAFRLVPRWYAGVFGIAAALIHAIGLPVAMFAGYPMILNFAYALLISYVAIGGWLVVKGFTPRDIT